MLALKLKGPEVTTIDRLQVYGEAAVIKFKKESQPKSE